MASYRIVVKWTPDPVLVRVGNAVERKITQAAMLVAATATNKVSTAGPPASKPGKPPHVDTGRLRQSITYAVTRHEFLIEARIGSNVEYARRLELGFVGRDAKGRNYAQAPRPFLRPSLMESLPALRRIFKNQ